MPIWNCQSCGGGNPDGTRFCGHCGAPLQVADTPVMQTALPGPRPEVTSTLRSFVSKDVATRLEESEGQLNEERRLVTAVFADISGFTALAERFDPEQLSEVIDPVVSALSGVIARHEGYVEKFAGDALLALFGAPVSHEDDAQRALAAALELHAELLRVRQTVPYEHDLGLHVGVNSGHGIARIFGTEARMDYAVLGDSIILAQRLESAAPTGQTYVGDLTYRLTKNSFDFEWVGELDLKGKAEPVPTWRLVGKLDHTPDEIDARSQGNTELVGREHELGQAGISLQQLADGRGGLLTVVGEAGVGKSRLAAELAHQAQRRGLRWMSTRCLAHGAVLAYSPFAQLVRDFARLDIAQSPELAASALAAALERIGSEGAVPYFARLLGLPPVEEAADVSALEPAAFRRGLHAAFSSWLSLMSNADRLALMIEDCQWMDPSSRDLAQELLAGPAGGRFLLCLTTRTDGEEIIDVLTTAAAAMTSARIELDNFDAAGVDRFLYQFFEASPPRHLSEIVFSRTGGNPYFVTELVRSLLDEDAIVRGARGWHMRRGWEESTIPPTLESVLSARIDRLPREARTTLLDAAVIGRRIPQPLLHGLCPQASEAIRDLVERGFFDVVAESGGELEFHNALVQEAAYSRLLRRQRRALHRRVAELAEDLYGAGDDVIDLLARHSYLGAVGPRAIDFLVRAGQRAARLFANEQAILHLTRALELARAEPDDDTDLVSILLSLGDLNELVGSYDEALENYREASQLSNDVRSWRGLVSVQRRQGRYREAERVVEDAFTSVRSKDQAQLWLERAWTLAVQGRPAQTVAAATSGLHIAAPDDPARAYLFVQVAQAEKIQGEHASALAHSLQARRLLEGVQDQRGLTTVLRLTASIYLELDDFPNAAATLREGLELAERVGNVEEVAGCLINLGMIEHQLGHLDEAILCDERAIEEFERIGHGAGRATAYSNLSEKLMDRGDLDEALRSSQTAYELARVIEHTPTVADALQTMAAIYVKLGDYITAAERAEEAVRVNLGVGATRYAVEAAEIASTAWSLAGRLDKANEARQRVAELGG